jgi:acyl-CoA synthetase (AMP-forming)/AMP-acid ligase II
MSVSVFVRLGVAAGLPLEFNTIDTIKDLFGKHSVYIYGISDTTNTTIALMSVF